MIDADKLFHFFVSFSPTFVNWAKQCNHSYRGDHTNPYHLEESVWAHICSVASVSSVTAPTNTVFFSSLCHDLGKPCCRTLSPPRVYFAAHESYGVIPAYCLSKLADRNYKIHPLTVAKITGLHMYAHAVVETLNSIRPDVSIVENFASALAGESDEFIDQLLQVTAADSIGRFSETPIIRSGLSPGQLLSKLELVLKSKWSEYQIPRMNSSFSPRKHILIIAGFLDHRPDIQNMLVNKDFKILLDPTSKDASYAFYSTHKVAVRFLIKTTGYQRWLEYLLQYNSDCFVEGLMIFPNRDYRFYFNACTLPTSSEHYHTQFPVVPMFTLQHFHRVTIATEESCFETRCRGPYVSSFLGNIS
ncbi:hypothetical protein RCL1_005569 [Eukaryota sp. TZLM3-RCL]